MCFNFMSANLCLKAKPGTSDLLQGMFELAMADLTVLAAGGSLRLQKIPELLPGLANARALRLDREA